MANQKKWIKFTDPDISESLLHWWKDLDTNRGDRADLRRCKVPEDVFFVPAYHRLRQLMKPFGSSDDPLGVVAGVLSHVNAYDGSEKFACQLARMPPGKDSPVMSSLRFRKLLSIRDSTTLFREGIRAVRLLDGAVNIPDLAQGLYWWNGRTRKEWALSYYENIV